MRAARRARRCGGRAGGGCSAGSRRHPGARRRAGPPARRARPGTGAAPGPQRLHDLLEPRRRCSPDAVALGPRRPRPPRPRPTGASCSCSTTARPTSTAEVAAALGRRRPPGPGDPRATPTSGLARARNVLLHAVGTTPRLPARRRQHRRAAEGVAAATRSPAASGAAFTYGTVVQGRSRRASPRASCRTSRSREPWLRSNYIDTMAVVDVGGAARASAAGPRTPCIEHVDDWALVHRIARAGELIGLRARGRRPLPGADRAVPPARCPTPRRARSGRPHVRPDRPAAGPTHVRRHRRPTPTSGCCGRRPAAARPTSRPGGPGRRRPRRPPDGAPACSSSRPGGVANLGDDAITVGRRSSSSLAAPGPASTSSPTADRPSASPPTCRWLGTLHRGGAVGSSRPTSGPTTTGLAARGRRGRGVGTASTSGPSNPGGLRAPPCSSAAAASPSLWGEGLVAPRPCWPPRCGGPACPYVLLAARGSARSTTSTAAWSTSLVAGARPVAAPRPRPARRSLAERRRHGRRRPRLLTVEPPGPATAARGR